jgi:simple sugar transport system ATP-binding protein
MRAPSLGTVGIFELADRVALMSEGTITYVSPVGETDRSTIGMHMAAH